MNTKLEGWRELEDDRQRESWERAQMIAYYSASANLKKGTKPNDLFKNPYVRERKVEVKEIGKREFNKRVKRLEKLEYKEIKGASQIR